MRQSENIIHMNPAHMKLAGQSPARVQRVVTVMSEANRNLFDSRKQQKSQQNIEVPQKLVMSQHPHAHTQNPPQFVRTADSGFVLVNQLRSSNIRSTSKDRNNPRPPKPVRTESDFRPSNSDHSAFMKSSLQQLYEEVNSLRAKQQSVQDRERAIKESQATIKEKQRCVQEQLNQHKKIFQEYNIRIQALHLSIENYERRQKDLLSQLSMKEQTIGELRQANDKLTNNLADTVITVQKLEKSIVGLKQEKQTLIKTCETLQQKVARRDEELKTAKEKVAEVVGTCYNEMNRLGAEINQHKTIISRLNVQKEQYVKQKDKQIADLENAISRLTVEKEEYKKASQECKARVEVMECTQKSDIVEEPVGRDSPKLEEILSTIFSVIKET